MLCIAPQEHIHPTSRVAGSLNYVADFQPPSGMTSPSPTQVPQRARHTDARLYSAVTQRDMEKVVQLLQEVAPSPSATTVLLNSKHGHDQYTALHIAQCSVSTKENALEGDVGSPMPAGFKPTAVWSNSMPLGCPCAYRLTP